MKNVIDIYRSTVSYSGKNLMLSENGFRTVSHSMKTSFVKKKTNGDKKIRCEIAAMDVRWNKTKQKGQSKQGAVN